MLAGVFQGVTESANKPIAPTFEKVIRRYVDCLSFDPNNLGSVLWATDLSPYLFEQLVWNIGTNINTVGVKVGVVSALPAVPTTELVTPEKPEMVRLDFHLTHAALHTSPNVLVELT